MIQDVYDDVITGKLKKSELIVIEKARLTKVIMSTNKLTELMACAGAVDSLYRVGMIDENDRQNFFDLIETKIKTIPQEDFRM